MNKKEMTGEEKTEQFIRKNKNIIEKAQDELDYRTQLMKPMSLESVQATINKINKFLSDWCWMDFIYKSIDREYIILCGCVDSTYVEPEIEITFTFPQMIASPFYWTMDEKRPFIQLSSAKELEERTGLYTYDNLYVFKLNNEEINNNSGIFISATGIKCNILKKSK